MRTARTIASLYARRRRLLLGLQDFERRAAVYRAAIAEIETELRHLVLIVLPLTRRKPGPHFATRELGWGCRDALREARGRPLTVDEVVIFLMHRKGLPIRNMELRSDTGRRVRGALRRLWQRGAVEKIGSQRDSRWKLAGPE